MATPDDPQHTLTIQSTRTLYRRRASLQVLGGKEANKQQDFEDGIRIGSRAVADFVIADPKVSGLHCEVLVGDALRVRDLGSKNGTFVGGVRVTDAFLTPGEALSIGETRIRVLPLEGLVEVPLHTADNFHGILGYSSVMRALTAQLALLAPAETTVLIQGETGTGKERVAEALHLGGPRAASPLVIVDCGAIVANLIESELFGHERGAFTGAHESRAGAFERADGGTVFLDEVGELPIELQPKLLRVLESREVRRIGGRRSVPFNVRVIAATNRDLAVEVGAARFREDLYYRLAVVTLKLPPLRERVEDLPLLIDHLARQMGMDPSPFLTVEALEQLTKYRWPGNVRELRNTLERAGTLAEPLRALGQGFQAQDEEFDLSLPLSVGRQVMIDRYEREYLKAMRAKCKGNISETARRAGLERATIYRMLHRHDLFDSDGE